MARTLLLTYLLVAIAYSTLVTSMTGEFIGPEWLSSVYDSLGSHLLRLNAEVDPDAIQWEGLRVKNKVYAYFGPFPAFLRIILNAVWPDFYGQWSRLTCLIAALLSVVAFGTMARIVLAHNVRLSEGMRRFLCAALVLGFAFGTPLTYLVSCARIYHEGILWGLCGSLWCVCIVAAMLVAPPSNNRLLFLFSCAVFVTLLSRITFGVWVIIAAPLVLLRGGAGGLIHPFKAPAELLKRTLAYLPLYAALGIGAWYNYARFGSVVKFFDYNGFYLKATDIGGEFNLLRISDTLRNYMRLSSEYFMSSPPFAQMTAAQYGRSELFLQGWREETIPYPVASTWLLVVAFMGLWRIHRLRNRALFIGYGICLALQSGMILSFYFVTQRYSSELLPFLCFLCIPWLSSTYAPRLLVVPLSILIAFSSSVTVAATLDWNMVHNGDASLSYKRRLRALFIPHPTLPSFNGTITYLSDLQPLSETASFTPMRRDRNVEGQEFTVGHLTYPKGLGVHAHSRLVYAVPSSAATFAALLSLSGSEIKCAKMSYRMRVLGPTGNVLFESPPFSSRTPAFPLELDVRGLSTLTLEVTPLEDGIDCDHANWILAQFRLQKER